MSLRQRWIYFLEVHVKWHVRKEKMLMNLAWAMPKQLAYMCAVRVISHATVGEYGDTVVPELKAIDALKRWDAKGAK